MSQKLKLIRRIITLLVIVVIVVLLFRWCTNDKDAPEFTISDTPMRVEMIRSIAEISTVSYRDEVVVDSLEYYKDAQEQLAGSILKLTDPKDFKYGVRSSAIKRRITMLVKGEIRYGFDLKKSPVKIQESDSLIEVFLPEPEIVDIQVTPSGTEIFQENGKWYDAEIRDLHLKARKKLIRNAEMLQLESNARSNMTLIMKQMLGKDKPFRITFENR